ncbi:MAG: hypothetical protein F7C34_04320 [Desulfurococcales archaeon]|nr:hypothetical protein [Desulfurococcales archaeon]
MLVAGSIPLLDSGNPVSGAAMIPYLELEWTHSDGVLYTWESIQTIEGPNGGYDDILAGYHTRPNGNLQFVAMRYSTYDPYGSWFASIMFINATKYNQSMFSDVENYVFVGSFFNDNLSSSVVLRMNQSHTFEECFTIFDPARNIASRLSGIDEMVSGNMIVVGAANARNLRVPSWDPQNSMLIATVDPVTCNLTSPVLTSKGRGELTSVTVVDDAANPYYGYAVAVGISYDGTAQYGKPYILVLTPSLTVVKSLVIDMGAHGYATSAVVYGTSIIVSGAFKTVGNGMDGFVTKIDLASNTTAWNLVVSTQDDDSVNDLSLDDSGRIAVTGYYGKSGAYSALFAGKLAQNGSVDRMYVYGTYNVTGNGVSVGPGDRIHVAGTISSLIPMSQHPYTLQQAPASLFQATQSPMLGGITTQLSASDPVLYDENIHVYYRGPGLYQASMLGISGLHIVINEQYVPDPITATGTITRPTNTTSTGTSPASPITSTVTRPGGGGGPTGPTGTLQGPTTIYTGAGGDEPCPCQGTIVQATAAMGAITLSGVALTYLLARRGR